MNADFIGEHSDGTCSGLNARQIRDNVDGLVATIARYRSPAEVRIICVSKGFDLATIAAARSAGLSDFGENYSQELKAKAMAFDPALNWHFIGSIQRNKLRSIAGFARTIQSVCRSVELQDLAKYHFAGDVLIQVHSQGGVNRNGVEAGDVAALVEFGRSAGLNISGLMGVAPISGTLSPKEFFRLMAKMSSSMGLRECSMGMSDDYELAVAEGATMIRVGRSLLGPRAAKV